MDGLTTKESEISRKIIGAAIEVHRVLGPGLLESVYQKCFAHELKISGLSFIEELPLDVHYKGVLFESAHRLDLMIEDKVIVELKAVEKILSVHESQLLSYLRLADKKLGLLLNFNVPVLKTGIRRIVNNL